MNYSIFNERIILTLLIAVSLLFAACTKTDKNSGNNSSSSGTEVTSSDIPEVMNKPELKEAPDFSLERMNGETFTLSEQKGKVVVLNIWATWCPPCRKEIPDFIEVQEEMREENVLFVGVSVDKEGWEVVRPFALEYGINYPLVLDDGTIRNKYGPLRGVPTTFIINKKGKIEYVTEGLMYKSRIKPVLEKLAHR
jgi:peroxiredoxin